MQKMIATLEAVALVLLFVATATVLEDNGIELGLASTQKWIEQSVEKRADNFLANIDEIVSWLERR